MDQCEDREEGVPPSKSTLCGEHESQTKAQRNPPGPPPSSVSLQSDASKNDPINFKVQPPSAAERMSGRPEGSSLYQLWTLVLQTVHLLILGPVCFIRRLLLSPVWRKIQKQSWTADSQSEQLCTKLTEVHKKMMMEEEEDRAESAGSSCPSVRSDRSKDQHPDFSGEPGPTRQCICSDQSASSGASSCPQCGERSRSRAGLQTASQSSCAQTDVGLQEVLDEHKISLRRRCERVTEGSDETGSRTLLNRIYTELYITEGQSEEVHTQHEFQPFIVNELLIPVYMTCKNNTEHIRLNMEKKHHSPASLKL